MKISQRSKEVPYSAIRKLTPYAEKAKSDGKKVYHLNVGAPDIETPREFFDAIKNSEIKTIKYAQSIGIEELRKQTAKYYKHNGIDVDPNKEIVITNGASEALMFVIIAITDIGDNILTCNPFYANYNTVFKQCGISINTFDTNVEDGYRLPDYNTIAKEVNDKTRAILLSNPSNPTGAVYNQEEIDRIVKLAKEKDIYIIADEVYREFVFDGKKAISFASAEGIEDRLILLDSISKRFGACGARIGGIICKNQELMKEFVKLATSRLSVATMEQIGAAGLYNVDEKYFEDTKAEYQRRRDCIYEEIQKIEGVKAYKPEGAFYIMPELPVKDTEDFAKWLLTEFDIDGETVMVAPGFGFYNNSNVGKSQVRIAYVVNTDELKKAIYILGEGLKKYREVTNQ